MVQHADTDYDKTIVHFSDDAAQDRPSGLPFTPVAVRNRAEIRQGPVHPLSLAGGYAPGLNPLVDAASSLLLELIRIKSGIVDAPEDLRLRLEAEVRGFSAQIRAAGISDGQSTAARYLLCTALDEAIVASDASGAEHEWSRRSLLSAFHNETWGGERFFQVLERAMQQPASNLYLLELVYILLSLGFAGKYRLEERGFLSLETLRDQAYKQIHALRGGMRDDDSKKSPAQGNGPKIHSHIPLWLTAAVALFCLGVTFWGFSHALDVRSAPLLAQFASLAPNGTPVPAPKRSAIPLFRENAPDARPETSPKAPVETTPSTPEEVR